MTQQRSDEEVTRQCEEDIDAAGHPAEPDVEAGNQHDRDPAEAVEIGAIRGERWDGLVPVRGRHHLGWGCHVSRACFRVGGWDESVATYPHTRAVDDNRRTPRRRLPAATVKNPFQRVRHTEQRGVATTQRGVATTSAQ
ncbi:Uncharacterised protein [Mycobacteroides abscessus subsp. abscessus]|nr:Uncharacterised protein [Mycobacteroides abscessus subsp. abscessus]